VEKAKFKTEPNPVVGAVLADSRGMVLAGTGSLFVDKKTVNYIKDLKRIALNAGWEPGTPLIDLTGWSPGANVILGARILGTPFLFGPLFQGRRDIC
jgi:hypothetical protein